MSSSLTPVFHQEVISYILSPFFYYQVSLTLHHLKKEILSKQCLQLCSMDLQNKIDLLCMEDYRFGDLEKERLLIVVTSTFGNGESPGNGETFQKKLMGKKQLKNNLRYCVFGLGSRMYPQFCAFAHAVDDKLAELGAKCVTPIGEGDELNGQDEAFSAWACTAFKAVCKEFGIEGQLSGAERLTDSWDPQKIRVQPDSSTLDCISALSALHSKTVFPMKLKRRKNLQSSQSRRSTILVELEVHGAKDVLNYAPGDHVGVFPENSPELVTGILKHIPSVPPTNQSLHLEYQANSGVGWQKDERLPACSLTQALTYLLDITTPPSQGLLRKLSQVSKKEDDRQRLLALASDFKSYSEWKEFRKPNFLEVLEEFPSLEVSAAFVLSQLPLMKPRLYSLSSSPDLHPNELHLTVSVVNYRTQDGKGPLHHGVCSTWLNTLKDGHTVPCFIHGSSGFHLPPDPTTPTILIGAGSGIAPFRSFWQQRYHDKEKKGLKESPMMLVFGCRDSDTDHLYKEETYEMRENGTLKSITPAYSRQPGHPKVYVQDVLKKQLSEEVWQALQKAGHVYVCGGMNMAREVAHTIQDIVAGQLGVPFSEAGGYLERLKVPTYDVTDVSAEIHTYW
uniref:Nitric oxide synthase, inducible n=1 Tax=Astyanax mexicanus TaxID=7994 RepID=A0A8B9LEB1_ASTMX